MNKLFKIALVLLTVLMLTACGEKVDVPPAHIGKIMTKDGYQENIVPPSSFRLPWCWTYCDKIVLLDTSDKARKIDMQVFMPEDKLNLDMSIQVTLSLNPEEAPALFGTLPPQPIEGTDIVSIISWDQIYSNYAHQIILTETRQYLSQYSIAEISSSLEKVNDDLRKILQEKIQAGTPFSVRYAGVTNIKYPAIITEAQENAAERRERIQSEEAQLQISKVTLERELQEAQLQRQIDLEKAETEAQAQRIQREAVDEKVLALRKLENERLWIEKWDGKVPSTMMGEDSQVLMQLPRQ
jgi:regulator of protease activity HflC (stomatin/prohibitin superfamily)